MITRAPSTAVCVFEVEAYASATGLPVTGLTYATAGLSITVTATDRSQNTETGAGIEALAGTVASPSTPSAGTYGFGEVGGGKYIITAEYSVAKTNAVGVARVDVSDTAGDLFTVGEVPVGYESSNAAQISGDSDAADNLEAACDGTTYNIGGGAIVVESVTGSVNGITGVTFPNYFGQLQIEDGTGAVTFANTSIANVTTTANLTNLPAITANWLTAAGIAANALDNKGNWNVGKTGYSLSASQTFNLTGNITGNLTGSVGSVTALADAATFGTRGLTMIEQDGDVYRYTTNALEQGPGSAGSLSAAQDQKLTDIHNLVQAQNG